MLEIVTAPIHRFDRLQERSSHRVSSQNRDFVATAAHSSRGRRRRVRLRPTHPAFLGGIVRGEAGDLMAEPDSSVVSCLHPTNRTTTFAGAQPSAPGSRTPGLWIARDED